MERARNILLVDERPSVAAATCELLRAHGFTAAWSGSAAQALKRLAQGDIGVLMTALHMAEMSGLELIERCRRLPKRVASVLCAERATLDDALAAVQSGVGAVLLRPDEPSQLLAAIERAIDGLFEHAQRERAASSGCNHPDCEECGFRALLDSLGDAVISTRPNGDVRYANPVAESLLGRTAEELIGRPIEEVFRLQDASGQPVSPAVLDCLGRGIRARSEGYPILVRHDGAPLAINEIATPMRDASGGMLGASLVFRDVSKARAHAERAAHDAAHDALTGLVNRREFERRLKYALGRAHRDGNRSVLLYMDLDRFKQVNDSCGHAAGDQLLRQLSQVLLHCVRSRDTLARLGGDEFALLLEGCDEDQGARLAEQLLRAVADYRFLWQGRHFALGASIGLAPITHDAGGMDALLSAVDRACYAAKDAGRNCVVRIHDLPEAGASSQPVGGNRLRDALSRQQLQLAAQQVRALREDVPPLVELYARLRDLDGALIPPGAFIPVAERYSQMPAIDRQVVSMMCEWLRENPLLEAAHGCVAINLSAQTLHDGQFADFAIAEFDRHGVSPDRVCFEIRETDALANLSVAHNLCERLRAHGVRIALDDFGSGLGASRLLKHLPVQYLKIDGALVREICRNDVDWALVKSLVCVAHELKVQTVAKFVEDDDVLARLRGIGVDYAQGDGVQETALVAALGGVG
jgi:Amt family ammonium transporter